MDQVQVQPQPTVPPPQSDTLPTIDSIPSPKPKNKIWIWITAGVLSVIGIIAGLVIWAVSESTRSQGYFKEIQCSKCDVLRITESVYSSPFTKAKADKVWEIPATMGSKTKTDEWSLEVKGETETKLDIQFTGKIYEDLKPIETTSINKWSLVNFDEGRVGGGGVGVGWEFVYFTK